MFIWSAGSLIYAYQLSAKGCASYDGAGPCIPEAGTDKNGRNLVSAGTRLSKLAGSRPQGQSCVFGRRLVWSPKLCQIIAFWAMYNGFGPLLSIRLGSR